MENKLISQLKKVLPERMEIPKELEMLYNWIEDNNLFIDDKNGYRIGFLYPENKLKDSWTEIEREGGTQIEFAAGGTVNLKYWFGGNEDEELKSRLCVFAQSGAEGSESALWLNDNNDLKVIHMGSGSGSTLSCVLADNMVDFIRLLAIGYDEICWNENFPYPPNEHNDGFIVKPNLEFQKWVKKTFNTTIPKTALEIVKHPATMDDDNSEDEFFNWYQKYIK